MKMSRDAREMKNYLEAKSGKPTPPLDLFGLEQLSFGFYPKFIKGAIDRFYNPNSKQDPTSINFYMKPVLSMGKAKRSGELWEMTDDHKTILWKISHYLLDDYNHEQLLIIKQMCETFTPQQIEQAIQIAKTEKVFNVNYLLRVTEGVKSREDYEKNKIQERRKLFDTGSPTNDIVVKRQRVELASIMDDWENTLENIKLQKKLEELNRFGDNR